MTPEGELLEEYFRKYVSEELDSADELSFAAWVSLTERMSAVEIERLGDAKDVLQNELAFVLFLASFAPRRISYGNRELLLAAMKALLTQTGESRLSLEFPKRGRPVSAIALAQSHERRRQIVEWLGQQVDEGVKLEAAVAEASEKFALSRSTIFAAWSHRAGYEGRHVDAKKVTPAYWDAVRPRTLWRRFLSRFHS